MEALFALKWILFCTEFDYWDVECCLLGPLYLLNPALKLFALKLFRSPAQSLHQGCEMPAKVQLSSIV